MRSLDEAVEYAVRGFARGRPAKTPAAVVVGELCEAEIESLAQGRNAEASAPKLRARHHKAAQYVAMGFANKEVALATGMSESYLSTLKSTPAFEELVSFYATREEAKFDLVFEQLEVMGQEALAEVLRRLDENPEAIGMKDLRGILADALDRLGYAKVTKNLSVTATIPADELKAMKEEVNSRETVRTISHAPRASEGFIEGEFSVGDGCEAPDGGTKEGPAV